MLGLDTNVLVRFLVQDDRAQFDRARRLIEAEIGGGGSILVSLLVVLETEWVLRSRYHFAKGEIADAIAALLDATEVRFEDEASLEEALYLWRDSTVELADCLIAVRHRVLGCRATATFDHRAAKVAGFIAA
jgi:predicted nucleic-acid-binding protein